MVLQIFGRRHEIDENQKIAFIADRDLWVLVGVPAPYESEILLLTSGYSIENDLFDDGNLIGLMSVEERGRFESELATVVDWFALASSRVIAGGVERLSVHPNEVLDDERRRLEALRLQPGETYPAELRARILADYPRLLRGKSLIAVLMRQLSYAGRPVRHNHRSLFEMVALARGPLINALFERVRGLFVEA